MKWAYDATSIPTIDRISVPLNWWHISTSLMCCYQESSLVSSLVVSLLSFSQKFSLWCLFEFTEAITLRLRGFYPLSECSPPRWQSFIITKHFKQWSPIWKKNIRSFTCYAEISSYLSILFWYFLVNCVGEFSSCSRAGKWMGSMIFGWWCFLRQSHTTLVKNRNSAKEQKKEQDSNTLPVTFCSK